METKFSKFNKVYEEKHIPFELTEDDYIILLHRLENKFKRSGNEVVSKLENNEPLTDEDLDLILRKLEYRYRATGSELIDKIKHHLELDELPNIKYSNLEANRLRKLRNIEDEE